MLDFAQWWALLGAIGTTFSSLILDDSCCNLVTTVVILIADKHECNYIFWPLTRLANSAPHFHHPDGLDYRFSCAIVQTYERCLRPERMACYDCLYGWRSHCQPRYQFLTTLHEPAPHS
jgi:hypothetical protein